MFNKIKNIFYLITFFFFLFFISSYYFSDQNVLNINKLRSNFILTSFDNFNKLPLLKNDTDSIIEYKNDIEKFKKKRKKYIFWDLIE